MLELLLLSYFYRLFILILFRLSFCLFFLGFEWTPEDEDDDDDEEDEDDDEEDDLRAINTILSYFYKFFYFYLPLFFLSFIGEFILFYFIKG